MRSTLLALGLTVAVAVPGLAGAAQAHGGRKPPVTTTTTIPATSPAQYLKNAAKAAAAAGSVHEVWSATFGSHSDTVTADVSTAGSVATLTNAVGSKRGSAQISVVGAAAYLNADTFTLRNLFGLSQSQAGKLAGKWISFTAKDDLYETIVGSASFSGVLDTLTLKGNLTATKPAAGPNGQVVQVAGLEASPADGAILTGQQVAISISLPSNLPFAELPAKSSGASKWSVQLSNWGEDVAPVAPQGAVSASSFKLQGHFALGK
jgi:hypothetical protein